VGGFRFENQNEVELRAQRDEASELFQESFINHPLSRQGTYDNQGFSGFNQSTSMDYSKHYNRVTLNLQEVANEEEILSNLLKVR
jgi:hypothetical protein